MARGEEEKMNNSDIQKRSCFREVMTRQPGLRDTENRWSDRGGREKGREAQPCMRGWNFASNIARERACFSFTREAISR